MRPGTNLSLWWTQAGRKPALERTKLMITIFKTMTTANEYSRAQSLCRLGAAAVVLGLIASGSARAEEVSSLGAVAQDDHSPTMTHLDQELTPDQRTKQSALLKIVRESTERFQDVKVAEYEGYHLEFGCVSGDDFGAMGLHYVNDTLVGNGIVDATHPQILLYEKQPNGSLKLNGADYLVIASTWDAKHPG